MNTINPSISTGATKTKVLPGKKKKTGGRTAKLKSSKWYQGAVQSIGISNARAADKTR